MAGVRSSLVRVLWIIRAVVSAQQLCFLQNLEVYPCHILALYAELVTFVLPPNSIPERLQQFQELGCLLGQSFCQCV